MGLGPRVQVHIATSPQNIEQVRSAHLLQTQALLLKTQEQEVWQSQRIYYTKALPAVQTWPMITSDTSEAEILARAKTSRMTMAPSSCAFRELRQPFKFPIGVLPAATITTSELLYPELAAIVKMNTRTVLGQGLIHFLLQNVTFQNLDSTACTLQAQVFYWERRKTWRHKLKK